MNRAVINGFDKPISRLVMGSMVCSTDTQSATNDLLDAYVAAGGNCIDTAHVYGEKSERGVGQWIKNRGIRDSIILIGKGAHPDSTGPRVNAKGIEEDILESLKRFQTDYIDIYLLHRDDTSVPVGMIVKALNSHLKAGQIRAFGGSNWTTERIQEANDYASSHGLTGFIASSPYCGLAVTNGPMWAGCLSLDAAGKKWHEEHQFPLFPWSSQAGGFFTGRYSKDDGNTSDIERIYYSDINWELLARAREVGEAKGCSANNIALAYALRLPFPVFPLIGPRSVEELASSLPALKVELTDRDMLYLEV